MRIGVPKEIKTLEFRVGATPGLVQRLVHEGHEVFVEAGRGGRHRHRRRRPTRRSARPSCRDADAVFDAAEMIVKVKEPQAIEIARLKPHHILFTYLHLAADRDQARGLMKSGCTAIAYETVTDRWGRLPLLAPMSQVAGRMAVDAGAYHLLKPHGGRGVLLGGAPGVPAAQGDHPGRRRQPASTRPRWRSATAPTSPCSTSPRRGSRRSTTSSTAG